MHYWSDLRKRKLRALPGRMRAVSALPTMVALAEHHHVSQATVTRVLRLLAVEGLVCTVSRWGTFWA